MRFYLGTHKPNWLAQTDAPLFVSARRLREMKRLPRAIGPWALDSGGFTELNLHGTWTLSPADYVTVVRRYRDEIGQLAWAAPQDWMCEPLVREKTGLSVKQHQDLTIENLLHLRALAPDLPIVPVLQGWAPDDYMRHVEAYEDAGVFLNREQLVGLGSVCRRSHLGVAETIVRRLHGAGIRLHGFGLKITAGERMRDAIVSCDSLAWSITARREAPLPGCPHKSCANCMKYALLWRERYLAKMAAPQQMALLA